MPADLFERLRQATINHKVTAAELVRTAIAREIDHLDREREVIRKIMSPQRAPQRTKRAARKVRP